MKRANNLALLILTALASGCASKETVYWTKHGDSVVVHHVSGKLDKTEQLTKKDLPDKEAASFGFAKGQKAFQVDETWFGRIPLVNVQIISVSERR